MGKVQVLAVLSMDGCLASELHGKSFKELRLDSCGINEIRENALYHITPDYSISILDEWRRHETDKMCIRDRHEGTLLSELRDKPGMRLFLQGTA